MAQQHGERHSGESITYQRIEPHHPDWTITLRSPGQEEGGRLADAHSAYYDNRSPRLMWNDVPGAVSYAIIVEDPDAPREEPFVHWMIWNIPETVTELPEGIPNEVAVSDPVGAVQGRNDAGTYGWCGPKPPPGHGVHRYYFQIFALDYTIDTTPDLPLEQLVNAIKGNAVAKGELVVTYEAPTEQ